MHRTLRIFITVLLLGVSSVSSFTTPADGQSSEDLAQPADTTRTEDDNPALTYDDGWFHQDDASASGGSLQVTGVAGAEAHLAFTGVSVKVTTKMGPRAGIMDIYLDGRKVRSFDSWSPTHVYDVTAYSTSDLELGPHTIEVRHSGRQNPSAGQGGFIHIDHIDTTDRPGVQAWVDQGFGLFVHYGINTFTHTTGSQGDPANFPSTLYDPTGFGADQWAAAAEAAGMRYLTYTVKHHYGWSGYPTEFADEPRYDITTSSQPDSDTVRQVVEAARAHNLTPILYYSAWDRTNFVVDGNNRNPQYTEFMKGQLTELLGGDYGDIPVLWVDIISHLSPEQRAEIAAHARSLRPGIVLVLNDNSFAPEQADIRNFEHPHDFPGAGALHPSTTDATTTIGDDLCAADVAGWWVFDNDFDPECRGWTRDRALAMRAQVNERNSTLGLNLSPGPSGQLSARAEAWLRELGPSDDRDPAISFTGAWNRQDRPGAHLSTVTWASAEGARATYAFSGTDVAVETVLGPRGGVMDILVDGTKVASFDSWSPNKVERAVAFQTGELSPEEHTIEVVATGGANPASQDSVVHVDSIQHWTQ